MRGWQNIRAIGAGGWKRPEILLLIFAAAAPLSFSTWQALLNNFAIERAAFTGAEMGILQSLREVPGFLAFAVVYVLLLIREQSLAILSLVALGLGTALTGFFPSIVGLYVTTVVMSIGFHYFYTLERSLTLQWIEKQHTPVIMGRMIAAASVASIVTFGLIWLAFDLAGLDFVWVYLIGGGATVVRRWCASTATWCCAGATGSITPSASCRAPGGRSSSSSPDFSWWRSSATRWKR
jgi:hypothetical protein